MFRFNRLTTSLIRRTMLSFNRSRKIVFIFPFLVGFVILVGFLVVDSYVKRHACNTLDSERMITELCSRYHNKRTFGSMCHMLCDQSVFKLKYCNGENDQYKKVSVLECQGCIESGKQSTVVLKSEYTVGDVHKELLHNLVQTDNVTYKVALVENVFRNHAIQFFGSDLSDKKDLITFIIGSNLRRIVEELNTTNAINDVLVNALLLGSQDEFFTLRFLGEKSYFPKLYGTCGHAYFAEFTPSLSSLNFIRFKSNWQEVFSMQPLHSPSWANRAQVAIGLLKLIREVQDHYATPMHICGVTARNFGLSESGDTVILDTDDIKFGTVVSGGKKCRHNDECGYNKCRGRCNQTTHLCEKEMTSNNLQVICRDLLLTEMSGFGLLRGAPAAVADKLKALLDICYSQYEKIFVLPQNNKSDRTLMKNMEELLTKSLEQV